MITLVRRFSVTLKGSSEFLPVLFIQEDPADRTLLFYCVVSSKGEHLLINPTEGPTAVTSVRADD